MSATWAWARSELRRRGRANVGLVLLISLSGAVVLTTATGALRTATAFDRFLEDSDTANVQVQYYSNDDVDADVLAAFRDHPDVEQAAPIYFTLGFSDRTGFDLPIVSGPDPTLFRDIDRPRVLEGRRPDPAAANEVLLTPPLQELLSAKVGDELTLGTFGVDQDPSDPASGPPAGPELELEVVGIATTPFDTADEAFAPAIATPAFFETYARDAYGEGPSIEMVARDGADAMAVAEEVTASFDFEELFLDPVSELSATVEDGTRAMVVGLWTFTAVAALAFLVANAQAVRRRLEVTDTDQPALRAIGLSRSQRTLAGAMSVAPMIAGGCALAVLLAVPASATMPLGAARRAEPQPGIDIDAVGLAAGTVLLAVILLASTLWSASRVAARRAEVVSGGSAIAARATPAMLLRARLHFADHLGMAMAIDPGLWGGRIPVWSAFAGAVLAIGGIAAVLTFGTSLDALVEEPARTGWNWTIRVDPSDEELDEIASIPDVEDVGRVAARQVVLDGDPVVGNAISSVKGTPSFALLGGRMPATDEEIALGPELADQRGLAIGDRVTMTDEDGEEATKVVVGEALFPTFDDDNTFNDGVALTVPALEAMAHSDGDATVIVTFADGISEEEAAERVAAVAPEAVSVYSYPSLPTDVANLDGVRALPRALGVFLALLGLAAIGHALATSVHRRRRELGTVRSFGFLSRDVRRAVAAQSTTLVLSGVLVGLPLGVVVGRTVWRAVADGLGVDTVPTVPVTLLAAVGLAAVLAGLLAAWFPGQRAGRGVALDALRAE